MNDYLRACILSVPAQVIGAYDMEIDETYLPLMVRSAERALLDWMGPGGDEAFLTMFALANAPMAFPITNHSMSHRVTPEELARDVRSDLQILARATHEKRHGGQRHNLDAARRGQSQGHESEWTTYLAEYAFENPKGALIARRTYLGYLSCTLLTTAKNGLREPRKHGISIVIEPDLTFRTALMGELAVPWDIPEGPFEGTYLDPRYETGVASRR